MKGLLNYLEASAIPVAAKGSLIHGQASIQPMGHAVQTTNAQMEQRGKTKHKFQLPLQALLLLK